MTRSEAARQEVLERDDYRCQICSSDANLCAHHIVPLGMGGSKEKDTPENMITLCTACHDKVHAGKLHIEHWDPDKGELAVTDQESRRVPDEKLWFYRRKLAEELQPIEARIQGLHLIDGQVAADLYRLWLNDAYKVLDPEAKSFREYSESRGWDTRRAVSLVNLYRRAEELGLEWPAGMTATDFRRELKNAGHVKERAFWYVVFSLQYDDPVQIVRTDSPDELVESLKSYQVAVRVGKWFGLQAKDGELLDRDGNPVSYDVLARVGANAVKQT